MDHRHAELLATALDSCSELAEAHGLSGVLVGLDFAREELSRVQEERQAADEQNEGSYKR